MPTLQIKLCPRLGRFTLLALVLAQLAAQAHAGVQIEVRGVGEDIRANVLAYLSFERYKNSDDLSPEFIERLQERSEREVRGALRPFGFYEPVVTSDVKREGSGGDQNYRVVINITPGKPVQVEKVDVKITGPGAREKMFTNITGDMPIQNGDTLDHSNYEALKGGLLRAAATNGYLDARMLRSEMRVDPQTRTAQIIIEFETGERYHFGATTIKQDSIDDALIRRYVRYREGDYFDATELLRTQFALDDSQYFSTVEVLPEERDREQHIVPISITAEPNRRHRYSYGVGYGTDTQVRGTVAWEDRRVNQRGHRFRTEAKAAATAQSIDARYVVPIGDPATEKFQLQLTGEHEREGDIDDRSVNFIPSFTHTRGPWFGHEWQRVMYVEFLHAESEFITSNRTDIQSLLIPGISFSLVPRKYLGEALFSRSLYVELRGSHSALGSDSDFLQIRMQGEHVFDIAPKWHVLMRGDIGATAVSRTSTLAPTQRFFAGGDRSVRGFGFNDLSPVELTTDENGDPAYEKVGGKHLLTGSMELIRDVGSKFAVAVFADAGNAFDSFDDPLMYSVGIGVRLRLPVVSVGIDVAQALTTPAGSSEPPRPAPPPQFLAKIVIKRRLKIAALVVGLLLALVLGFLAWVIYTEAGLRFAVARLPEHMGKVTLHIERVYGTIAGGFGADLVDIDSERTRVRVEKGAARVNFWPLLVGRIAVRAAGADLVEIEVKRRLHPPPKTPPKFLPRFLSISAETARSRLLVIIAPNGRRVEFNDVTGSGIVGNKTIRIFDSNVTFGVLQARSIGELTAADPMLLSGETTTRMIIEGQPTWRADSSFEGTLDKLPLSLKLFEPFRADMRGELLMLSSNFHWTGKADVHNFDLAAFGGGSALGIITGTLDVGGEMNAFHARGPLMVPGLGSGPFAAAFEGNYSDHVVYATHYEFTHKATGSHVDGQGTIEPAQNGPKLLLQGNWRGLRWPLAAHFTAETPQIFSSPEGKYHLEGLWPYAITASGDLLVPQLDPMTVAVRGALHKDHLQMDELQLGAFGGKGVLAGEARWSPEESWSLAGNVKGINPGSLRPGFSGSLDFNMKASGAPFGGDGTIDFGFSDLSGKLRGNTATGSGRIVLQGENWTFDKLRFRAGNTRLAIDGELGSSRALNLDFSLDADNLALLADGASGELHASGRVGGTSDAPIVKLTARGSEIEHGTLSVDKLAANIDVDWRGQRNSHADIAISGLKVGERSLTQFNATLDGTTAEHAIRADALAGITSLHLSGKGGFAEGVWKGTIGDLFIDDTANINLQLDTPVKIRASAKDFKLDALCMHGKVARLCGEAAWNETGWTARADASNLPISTLTAGLTPNVEYQGTVNATAIASSTGGAPPVGEARVDLVDAAIKHKLASGRTDVINFGSGFVTLKAEPAQINGELRLDAAQRGLISGRVHADRAPTDLMYSPMRGQLQMSTGELSFLTLYFPAVDRASGHFDANVTFEGTLGAPRASGVVKLSGAELDLYQLNLALRAVEMEARIASNKLEFTSTAKAGAGTLASSGQVEWRDGLPYGEIRVDGENLRVVDVPEARIDASPDLDFRIAGREIMVNGEVKVPLARLQPADLTNAVLPSADERLVGPTEQVEKDPFLVTSVITMTLGDKVTIDTYGLVGHITGSITERSLPGEPTRATGELQVKDGTYTALARKLDIERGKLIFGGGLLADPAVDIRAIKEFPDVKAGVNVRGSLRAPRLTFFSEPTIPQAQIVSLLLAGGSLQTAQNQGRAGSPAAQQEVAAQAGAILAAQLGNKLGVLPDISVESTLDNETSLVLGKYLSPRLYVSYGVSLTESINTFKMRYTINDRWTIKTESGKEIGADLVYTIEK